eukprot:COSAG06_NODE_31429_length_521_cov_8.182464_2_plen_40_part_01
MSVAWERAKAVPGEPDQVARIFGALDFREERYVLGALELD